MKELTPIEKIFSEDNNENVVLYNGNDEPVEFEQVAIVPLDDKDYCILKPVKPLEGMADNEALVFFLNEDEDDDTMSLELEPSEEVVDKVFDVYYELLDEQLAEVKEDEEEDDEDEE